MGHCTDINQLPDEVLLKIFSYLTINDLIYIIQQVSKHWQMLGSDTELWRNRIFTVQCNHKDIDIVEILKKSPQLRSIYLARPVNSKVFEALTNNCTNITDLELCCQQNLNKHVLKQLIHNCVKIKTLTLPNHLFTKIKFVQIIAEMKLLKTLCLTEWARMDKPIILKPLAKGCPSLINLFMGTSYFNMEDLEELILAKCHQLVSLNLRWCVSGRNVISSIIECGSSLKHLTLWDYNLNIEEAFVAFEDLQGMSNLQKLEMPSLSYFPSDAIANLFSSRKLSLLKELDLRHSLDLEDTVVIGIIEGCPILQKLHLIGANQITDACLKDIKKCTMLKYLDLSGCCRLGGKAIKYVSQCQGLKVLHLGHLQLDMLKPGLMCVLDIHGLQVLNLEYSYVAPIPFSAFPFHLKSLKHLILGGSSGLDKEVVEFLAKEMTCLTIVTYPPCSDNYPELFGSECELG